ncbi:MAG: hypothetical protein WC299_13205 [Kiritimatiellia bacterium]|jgi:hypothetical protein
MPSNSCTVEILESKLEESDSLVEHILITCDFIEFQINRMLSHSVLDMEIVRELNFSPEQRFSYALASGFVLGIPGEKYPADFYYFWGRLNEVYNLRRVMRNLTPEQLDERVKRLYHAGKFEENKKSWQGIITLIKTINDSADDYGVKPFDFWDPFAMALCQYLVCYVDGYVDQVTANEASDQPDANTAELCRE